MELWTEYEGRTIDGAFPLKRLLLPEGRSAFFSTLNGNGVPTVIRLIESHFDEEEILARWHGVEALSHPNLLRLERYGQLLLDDTSVIYAVMEPVDANLAEVIGGRRLTVSEAKQLASSLSEALDVLHTNGFVHGHVEPANAFAVGDVVKLRSDCIRESLEGEEGLQAKRRDVHDLSVVLLQTLTQQRTLEAAAHQLPLPSPFDQIVRKGISGEWGLAEIKAALPTAKRPPAPSSPAVSSKAPNAPNSPNSIDKPAAAKPVSLPNAAASESQAARVAPPSPEIFLPEEGRGSGFASGTRLVVAAGLVVLLALWIVWHFAHSRPANENGANQVASAPASTQNSDAHTPAKPTPAVTGTNPQPAQNNAASGPHAQWRVVVYTYNREDQAQKKSATIAQRHPELRPEVFQPNGHPPFLVTVGGAMNRDEAFAFAQKSRNLGLPRDTYAQNYSGKGR